MGIQATESVAVTPIDPSPDRERDDAGGPAIPLRWYALYVASNAESRVLAALSRASWEGYWPFVEQVKWWKGHKRTSKRSLMPGYLFARLAEEDLGRAHELPWVVRVVGLGDRPQAIHDSEIEALRILLAAGVPVSTSKYQPARGDKIRIRYGPLAGVEGTVSRCRGKCKVRVSIEMLNRTVSAEVLAECLEPRESRKSNTSSRAISMNAPASTSTSSSPSTALAAALSGTQDMTDAHNVAA